LGGVVAMVIEKIEKRTHVLVVHDPPDWRFWKAELMVQFSSDPSRSDRGVPRRYSNIHFSGRYVLHSSLAYRSKQK